MRLTLKKKQNKATRINYRLLHPAKGSRDSLVYAAKRIKREKLSHYVVRVRQNIS